MYDGIAECFSSPTEIWKWDEKIFGVVCEAAVLACSHALNLLDDELARTRCKDLRMIGKRTRKIVTKFGVVAITRRLYRSASGKSRFLLDEALCLRPRGQATPSLEATVSILASKMPFRQAAHVMEMTSGGVLSHQMIHTAVRRTADAFDEREKDVTRRLVGDGELPPSKNKKVSHLFVEADGTFINLQRERKKKAEVKLVTSHEGWERVGRAKWKLENKTVLAGLSSSQETWDRFSASLLGTYHPQVLSSLVIGGDGAAWIAQGANVFGGSIYQLDRFHIKRAFLRSTGSWRTASNAYRLAVSGNVDGVTTMLDDYAKENPDKAEDLRKVTGYIRRNAKGLVDYRERIREDTTNLRGLGAIESNIDKVLANRMKKRGMSWSLAGAHRMAKLIQMSASGLLGSQTALEATLGAPLTRALEGVRENLVLKYSEHDTGSWLEAGMPALRGPHQGRRWVKTLRQIAQTMPVGM